MYQAKTAHHLRREVPFLAAEGGAAGEGNPLRAVDRVSRGILRDEAGIARLFDALRQPGEHVVPGDLLPVVGTRRAIQGVFDAAGAGGELHRGGTLRTEPSLVDGAVRIALDLQQLCPAVGIRFRVGDQRAADRAVGTDGVRLFGVRDVEALLELSGLGRVEPEGCEAGRTSPGSADLRSEEHT